MDCILAVDVGTQSLKVGVLDQSLTVLERQAVSVATSVKHGDWVEMDAEELWAALVTACNGLKMKDRVVGMVFSTLCPSLVPISAEGKPLYSIILHQDRRSGEQARWALEQVGEETFMEINGNLPVPGGISLTSLLWIRDNLPKIYNRDDVCFGHVVTFFLKRLCGEAVIDPSNASFTGLYDTVGYGDWHERLYRPLDIDPAKLPRVQFSNTVVGELDKKAAEELGLLAGLPLVTGANDTTCAAIGAEVTKSGEMMNTSGTVDILVLCLEEPIVSRKHLLRTHAYPGKWLAMRTVGAGGGSLEWFRKNFCRELSKEEFYTSYLTQVLTECLEPRAVFQPFLSGDRHSIKRKMASFDWLSLDTSREEMLLALLHGIVSFQFEALAHWEKHVSLSSKIYHVGGGARSAYTGFKQKMLQDYKIKQLGETTLTGAATLAFEVLGIEMSEKVLKK